MSKLNREDKVKIIQLYNEGYGCSLVARKIGISEARVKEIKKQYDLYGDVTLEVSHTNRKFSLDFKMELINRVNNGEAIYCVAAEYMISPGQLYNWLKKYQELGYNGLINKPKGRPKFMKPETKKTMPTTEDEKDKRIRELEERNAQLEMENDLLKKLKALVQQRTQQQDKKK